MQNRYGLNDRDLWEEKQNKNGDSDFISGQHDNLIGEIKSITEKDDGKWAVMIKVLEGPLKESIIIPKFSTIGKARFFTRQLFIACGLYTPQLDRGTNQPYLSVEDVPFSALKGKKLVFDTILKNGYTNSQAYREYDPNAIYDLDMPFMPSEVDEEIPF